MCKPCLYKKLFLYYSIIMLLLLLCRQGPDINAADFSYRNWVADQIHLIPMETCSRFWRILTQPENYIPGMGEDAYQAAWLHAAKNLAGNVVLFIPLGFFPPLLWDRCRRLWKTGALAAATMVIVEFTQVLTLRGQCDIDDVILNTLGAAIGYGIFYILQKRKAA